MKYPFDFSEAEFEKYNWFSNCNTEELLAKAIKENWSAEVFKMWCMFKQTQSLETIALVLNSSEIKSKEVDS